MDEIREVNEFSENFEKEKIESEKLQKKIIAVIREENCNYDVTRSALRDIDYTLDIRARNFSGKSEIKSILDVILD